MRTHNTLPWYLPLKETLLQSIGGVTVYHYCPWAIMIQIEGFAVKHTDGAGTRRVVDMGTLRQGRREVEIHVLKEPHMCVCLCWITSKVELVRQMVKKKKKRALQQLQYVLVLA